jgi:hypothetical protein
VPVRFEVKGKSVGGWDEGMGMTTQKAEMRRASWGDKGVVKMRGLVGVEFGLMWTDFPLMVRA